MARSDHHRMREPGRFIEHSRRTALAEKWDAKTRQLIVQQIGLYVRRHAAMLLEFPATVQVFAEDYDCLGMIGRQQAEREHDVVLVRGPSREEYQS